MPNLASWLQAVRERLAKATPGLWEVNDQDVTGVWRIKYPGEVYPSFVGGFYKGRADAELAANAPTDLTYACQVIEVAQGLVKLIEITSRHYTHETTCFSAPAESPCICGANLERADVVEALATWHRVVEGKDE